MKFHKATALALLVLGAAALLIPVGCSSAKAATYDVTYYYLPG